jgi:hypothetical protein
VVGKTFQHASTQISESDDYLQPVRRRDTRAFCFDARRTKIARQTLPEDLARCEAAVSSPVIILYWLERVPPEFAPSSDTVACTQTGCSTIFLVRYLYAVKRVASGEVQAIDLASMQNGLEFRRSLASGLVLDSHDRCA